jgi:hypothetical protein
MLSSMKMILEEAAENAECEDGAFVDMGFERLSATVKKETITSVINKYTYKTMETNLNKTEPIENEFTYEDAWELLGEKGLSLGEKLNVRIAFAKWAQKLNSDVDIEFDSNYNIYYSKKIKGFYFKTKNEAKIFNLLVEMNENVEHKKIIQAMSVVFKLLDIDSNLSF